MSQAHLSSETLDLLLLGALREDAEGQARSHLDGCARCKASWEQLSSEKAHFDQFVFPRSVAAVEKRARERSPWKALGARWRLVVPALGFVATALAVVVLLPQEQEQEHGYVGVKGGGMLKVFARRGESQFLVTPRTVLHPGDQLRFRVGPGSARYLLVIGWDGSGAYSAYYPPGGAQSVPLSAGEQELPGSVELDQVTGSERILALFSTEPLSTKEVISALERGQDAAGLPGVTEVLTLPYEKQAP